MPNLGSAYVQVIPSAKGIKGSLTSALSGEAGSAGTSAGKSIAGKIKGAIAAAGIGATVGGILKTAIDEGGKLQQSYGGLETIYGDAADAAKKYAVQASQAGISANDYAEQAVSFGASLKQAFEGDTSKAVEAANTAILDMTDNAAKMGTPLENIQNAYQGFAKQNYTMLDNLSLGYGGTKTEMERLLADAQELTGVEYNIDNLGDVYEAIHVIQGELGLTGVAAAEASTTLTGSFEAVKASFSNFMANLALGEDIKAPLMTLISNVGTFLFGNLLPAVGNVFKALPSVIITLVQQGLPTFMAAGGQFINGVLNGIQNGAPQIVQAIPVVLRSALQWISDNLPTILAKGREFIVGLANGIIQNIPTIANAAADIIDSFVEFIGDNLPTILEEGGKLVVQIGLGIIRNLPAILGSLGRLALTIMGAVAKIGPLLFKAGISLVSSMAKGLGGMALGYIRDSMNKIKEKITKPIEDAKDKLKGIIDKIKGFFPFNLGKIINFSVPSIELTTGSKTVLGKTFTYPTGFHVAWHAKAMTDPYMFTGGTLFGAGEAGDEILYGRKALMQDIAEATGGKSVTFNQTFYIDGAEDPEDCAYRIANEVKLQLRTI